MLRLLLYLTRINQLVAQGEKERKSNEKQSSSSVADNVIESQNIPNN